MRPQIGRFFATWTKAGVGFIAAGVVVYIMGSQTQVGWLYLFDAIIWNMVLLSAFLPWWSLRSLRAGRQVWLARDADWPQTLAKPMEDDSVEVRIKISNGGRLARHLIKVVEDCPFDSPFNRRRVFLLSSIKPESTDGQGWTA